MTTRGQCYRRCLRGIVVLGAVMGPWAVVASEPPLPNPLRLDFALSLADASHPDLDLALSDLERSRSRALEADALSGTRAWVDVTPERVDPSTGGGSLDDSRARLVVTKPLYDFGRSSAVEASAAREVASREAGLLDARAQRRIEIMARFFDVLLADLRYGVDNEDMAHKYVLFDRLRERLTVGQVSSVELNEAENRYREALVARTAAQKRRSAARQRLASALNRPEQLPAELETPKGLPADPGTPEFSEVLAEAMQRNPRLEAYRRDVEAARLARDAERARHRPVLSGEMEAAEFERALAARSDRRVMLNLRIPIYQGSDVEAAVARATAELAAREARLRKQEHELRQAVLDAVQDLETLKVRKQTAEQRLTYRDQYLDRQRALYEMELQVSLGDAMTKLTEAQWEAARVEFDTVLALARLDALRGRMPLLNTNQGSQP